MLSLHAKQATLQPVVLEPPLMHQELDVESCNDKGTGLSRKELTECCLA
jgi:hypothetical protein